MPRSLRQRDAWRRPRPVLANDELAPAATPSRSERQVSGGREPPPPALAEPYVTVSRRIGSHRPASVCRGVPVSKSVAVAVERLPAKAVPWSGLPQSLELLHGPSDRCSSMRRAREYNSER